ncbi:MAG TPA: hypothetical protein VNR65_09830, partial [Geobacterales bacterium]|nr:hypothetical protein [Geobacterales bacterium]
APGAQPKSSHIGPAEIYPDSMMTPGAANIDVTQQNIQDNICSRRWSTKQIRPPSEYTSKLKRKQLRQYGDTVHQTRAELINPNTGKLDTTRCVAHSDPNPPITEERLGFRITQQGICVEKTPLGGMRRAMRVGVSGRKPPQVVQGQG